VNPWVAIQLALLLPLAGAALALLLRRRAGLAAGAAAVLAAATTAVLASQLGRLGGPRPAFDLVELFPGVWIGFRIEPLGLLFASIATTLWIPASLHAGEWLRARGGPPAARLQACAALAVAAAVGAGLARNLLTLFVFLELLPLACAPLVAHTGEERARRAARTFLGALLGVGGTLTFLAVVWTFHLAGTLELRPGGILAGRADEFDAGLLLTLFAFGIGPLSFATDWIWRAAAVRAPPPSSAFPLAAVLGPAGAFAFVKVAAFVFGPEVLAELAAAHWLRWAAALVILWAAREAWRARGIPMRVAHAALSGLAGLALGTLVAPRAAAAGGALYLAAHASGAFTALLAAPSLEPALPHELGPAAARSRSSRLAGACYSLGALVLVLLSPLGAWSAWRRAPAEPAAWLAILAVGALATGAAVLGIPVGAHSGRHAAEPVGRSRASPAPSIALAAALLAGVLLCFIATRIADLLGPAG
jgi:multicomponent Na+:H+ antiporter subunit D